MPDVVSLKLIKGCNFHSSSINVVAALQAWHMIYLSLVMSLYEDTDMRIQTHFQFQVAHLDPVTGWHLQNDNC